jgi:predicted cobalt transporter CbtA
MQVKLQLHQQKLRFKPESPLKTFTISLVVIPAISGVPVPGAKAGSSTSISIDKYKGLFLLFF